MPQCYRQGDVLLVRAGSGIDLSQAKRRKARNRRVVLALGEVTGHSHTMTAERTKLYDLFDGREVVVVDEPDTLTHQEHAGIEVAPGTYFVVHQVEYTPKAIVRVLD